MFDLIRAQPRRAAWALGLPALVVIVYLGLVINHALDYNDGYLAALLDDTWIHVRFAESISEGRGLMYNDGVVTSGATSPLWVLSLGAAFALFNPGIDAQVHTAVLFSAAGTVLAVLAISGFGWFLLRRAWVGLLAGLLTALTGRFIWMGLSGMEITTFTALTVLAVWSHVDDLRRGRAFGWRTGIIAALATLARPEGYLLAALLMLDAFIFVPLRYRAARPLPTTADTHTADALDAETVPGGFHWWRTVRPGWRGLLAYGLLAGSYPLVCLLIDGHPLPNTFRVKSQLGEATPDLLYGYFWTPRVDYGWPLIALAGIGAVYLLISAWRGHMRTRLGPLPTRGLVVVGWPVAFVIAVLFLGPNHFVVNNARYVAPAIPWHALLAAAGVWIAAAFISRRINRARPGVTYAATAAVLAAVLAGMVFWNGRLQGHNVARDIYQLRTMHVAAGHWVRDHTEPGDIIALNDVGAIAHISDRPVLDLIGLVSPEVIEPISEEPRFSCPYDLQLARVMMEQSPRFIGVFPWFFPCMTNDNGTGFPDMLQPFTVFSITGPTVIAGGEMVMYWPVWENWPVQRSIPHSAQPVEVAFDDGITLGAAEITPADKGYTIALWWTPEAQPTTDYTVFAHLIDAEGAIIGQLDSRPQQGRFNTLWWRAGDIIPDFRAVNVADPARLADAVAVRVGLYATDGSGRLPRLTAPPEAPDFVIIPLNGNQPRS
ncbi:MAG: hypothetical protein ACOCZH_01325 [Phototrophicaceae bacterium]